MRVRCRFGALLLLGALGLAGCDQNQAATERPSRPVLVTTVRYQPESPPRSFVATIRPRIESDLGFRVGGVVALAAAAEARAQDLRSKGWSTDAQLDQVRAAATEARSRLSRAERSVELTRNSLSYARLAADADSVVTATMIECYFLEQSWDWQFRGDDPPMKLLRHTWRRCSRGL